MADNYISTNMESGVKVKEALERIESYEPGLFVWTEVSDSVTVNLKSPTTYSGIKDPGDYVIYKFSNGPAKIPSTLAPVLLSLRNGSICVTANNMVFMLNGDNWVDMSESTDTDTTIFVKSDIAPVRTENCYWFDTSKYATEGYITLKYYDTDTSTWMSVFNEERYLKKSELDPDNKNTDVYDYITTKVAGVVGEYGEFMKHVANQLTYIHVSAEDRKAYGKIITKDQLQTLLEKTYTPAVKTVVDQTVSDGLGTTALENSLTTLKDNITSHLEGHVTAEDITRWKNKAEKNHTHDYTQGNTKLDASQIVSGIFGEDQLPDEIKERYYKITAASPAAEFSSSSITADMRKGKYHNGNGFYFETTDSETGKVTRQWYRIIDSSKVGTSNWAQGVVDFTATEVNLDWNQISGKPSSLEEFGITTDLYTKTEINEKFSSYDSNITELNKDLETANEEVSYEFDVRNPIESTELTNLEETENPKIDRIGLQIRKDSTTFSDNATGSIPQIDVIIKTTDGKIYKATQNLNSTYTDYDGNKTTTTNAAEPIGASMCEKFMKEYEWRNQENLEYNNLTYGNNIYVCNTIKDDKNQIMYSKNGKSWNTATGTNLTGILYNINFCNNMFIATTLSYQYAYSTDGINWTQKAINESYHFITNIYYANGKYVAFIKNTDDMYNTYSTDLINWTIGSKITMSFDTLMYNVNYGTVNKIVYGNTKFVAVGVGPSNSSNMLYSTDGINWNEGMISSFPYDWADIKYINDKFYALGYKYSDYNRPLYKVIAYSTNGINWIIPTLKWSDNTEINIDSGTFNFYKFDDTSLIGYFVNNSWDDIVLAKSIDGITWTKIYSLGTDQVPNSIVYTKDGVVMTNNFNGSIVISYLKLLHYSWTVNVKSGQTFAANNINDDTYAVLDAYNNFTDTITVDTTYNSNSIDKHSTGAYRFSGWSKTGNITFTKDTPRVTEITGTWNWVDMVNYSYSWNAPSYSDLTGLVTLPTGGSAYAGDTVSVDTKYNSDSKVEVLNWTQGTMPSNQYWSSVCYGNDKFVAVVNNSNVFAYSTDGITWTQGTLPSEDQWGNICYGNGKYIAIVSDSSIFAYSTDGITWTQGTMPSSQRWMSICYGNGKFVAVVNNSNVFAYSTDGITWTQGTIPVSAYWNAICYGNGKYIAIVSDSSIFAYSTDGITWTQGTLPSSQRWSSVCYGNDKFVTISTGTIFNGSNVFAYSTDGITWTQGTLPSKDQWGNICYGNGIFVVITDSQPRKIFAYSTDGITWTQGTMPSSQTWVSICYGNGKYIAIVYHSNVFAYLTLPTSYYQFSGWNPSTDFIINENKTISGTWSKKNKLKVSYSWSNQPSGMKSKVPSDEYYHYGDNVMVDTTYNNKSGYKEETWKSSSTVSITNKPNSSCYGNGKFVAIGIYSSSTGNYEHNTYVYSTDGITWTQGTLPSEDQWGNICYGNGKFVAIARNSNKSAYSTDGINWTEGTMPINEAWYSVCYGNEKFVAVVWYSNIFAYSTNGITWTQGTMPSNEAWYSVCYGNDKFVAVASSSNVFAYSEDGITWTQGTLPVTDTWTNVYYCSDKFIAVVKSSKIFAYSTDGINWTQGTLPVKVQAAGAIYANNKYILVSYSGYYLYSTDGINWNYSYENLLSGAISLCYGNNKIVATRISTTFAYLSPTYYQFSGWNKSNFNITSNTAVSGSWSQVSSGGGGLILVN